MRQYFIIAIVIILALIGSIAFFFPPVLWTMVIVGPVILLGLYDYFQTHHAVTRNFPLIGHFRFLLEEIRPEIYQYFIESETDGRPFSRDQRSLVYQRAKNARDTIPFGTLKNVYEVGYEWVNHSMQPLHLEPQEMRVTVGGPDCSQPYLASLLNISAMSYGALSKNAVLALNQGAKLGNFAHNTGEGGISPYHLEGEGDLIWQIGTGAAPLEFANYIGSPLVEGLIFVRNALTGYSVRDKIRIIASGRVGIP